MDPMYEAMLRAGGPVQAQQQQLAMGPQQMQQQPTPPGKGNDQLMQMLKLAGTLAPLMGA